MKNFYSLITKKISSLKEIAISRDPWRSKGAGILMAAFILSGAINTASAQVFVGTSPTVSTNVPVNAGYQYNYSQQIYTSAEINASGAITGIRFKANTANPANWQNSKTWVVYMGHTTKSTFSSGNDWIALSELTQVFDGSVAYPTSTPDYVVLTFSTPFVYNNSDNLVIAIDENTPLSGGSVSWGATLLTPSTNTKVIYQRSNTVNMDPAAPTLGFTSATRADVVLDGITMSCPPATAVIATNTTSTSTTLSWTAAEGTSSTGYAYEIRTSGTAGSVGSGLVASGTTADGVLTATISVLSADMNYTAYVRSLCVGTDASSWSPGTEFRTGYCIPSSNNATTYLNSVATTGGTATNISNLDSGFTMGGYQNNYATQSITTFATSTVQISFNIVGGTAGVGVWVDFNNDLVFDATEKIYAPAGYQENGDYTVSYTVPADAVPGEYRMRIKLDYNATSPNPCSTADNRSETEDYKVIVVAQSLDAPDSATVGTFTAGLIPTVVTSIQSCQSVEVSATVTEPGLTDLPGAAETITGWIGKSSTNTDPATWPESAWILATYSVDQADADLYTATFNDLTIGDQYFASRFRIGTGVYVFGGQNGLWNETTNTNASLAVTAIPAITATTSVAAICDLSTATLTAASENANFEYSWMPGTASGATTDVTPSETTIYTVTGTDSITGCTSTATVTVIVNPTPTAIVIVQEDMSICEDTVVELISSATSAAGEGQIGTDETITTTTGVSGFPNPFNAWYGGARNQMVYTKTALEAIGLEEGSSINSIGFEIAAINGVKTCNDFTIKIGTTTMAALTAFVSSTTLTTVYNQTFTPTEVGPISFNFLAPFIWDGESNLIVETTHNAGNYGNGAGTTIKYTSTGTINTSFFGAKDGITPATAAAFNSQTTYDLTGAVARRPNVTFGFIASAPVSWTPVEGLFTDAAATIAYVADANALTVYAKPTTTTTYIATASTASCSVSDSVAITVIPTPDTPTGVSPQAGSTIADLLISSGTTTWYASEDEAMTGENPLPVTTTLVDGATYYAVNMSGNCRSEALAILIDLSLSTQSYDFASLKYYPNPVTDVVNISFSENITAYSLFNMIGQQVLVGKVNATSTSVDMSSLPSGSYMMQIQTANASKTIKLIKK